MIKECIPDVELIEDIGRVFCVAIPFRKNTISERCRQIKNLSERMNSLKTYMGVENYEIRQSTLEEVCANQAHSTLPILIHVTSNMHTHKHTVYMNRFTTRATETCLRQHLRLYQYLHLTTNTPTPTATATATATSTSTSYNNTDLHLQAHQRYSYTLH